MEARKLPVTLVCATADETVAESVMRKLEAGGRRVELVVGADEQPRLLGEALDRAGDAALVVVCESGHLDGPAMRRVEGVFGARRGPKHGLVRIDLSQSVKDMINGIERATEALGRNQGRLKRRTHNELHLREVVQLSESSGIALPVVRLAPGEQLDGDTTRMQLPDNPISSELVRRRKVVREREREQKQRVQDSGDLVLGAAGSTSAGQLVDPFFTTKGREGDSAKLRELATIALIIAAGLVAILATLLL